ncbi:MAG: ATP synthase subunit I [Pseudomonadota bacterium]|nr:ATP synthase subunit I [Pseudomonadota bacterium]
MGKLFAFFQKKQTEGGRVEKLISRMMLAQVSFMAGLGVAMLLLFNREVAFSGVIGGLIWLFPNYHMAQGLMTLGRELKPEERLRKIYLKSVLKVLYSVALFVIAIVVLNVDFLATAGVYLILVLTGGVAFTLSEGSMVADDEYCSFRRERR